MKTNVLSLVLVLLTTVLILGCQPNNSNDASASNPDFTVDCGSERLIVNNEKGSSDVVVEVTNRGACTITLHLSDGTTNIEILPNDKGIMTVPSEHTLTRKCASGNGDCKGDISR